MNTVQTSFGSEIITGKNIYPVIGKKFRELFPRGKAFVITDTNVAPLWLDKVTACLSESGIGFFTYIIPAGEKSKNKDTLFDILGFMLGKNVCHSDSVIALGGGIVGDISALAASLCLRGIGIIQMPTSLLAMVDSSVGGKAAIDFGGIKNSVGAFIQPSLTVSDTVFLDTLPEKEYACGMAEIIKYGIICDKDLFEMCRIKIDNCKLEDIVFQCVKIKSEIVGEDELDKGKRRILNLGHSFGHAIEVLSDYKISHGEAVAKGLVIAAEISGVDSGPVISALEANGLETDCDYSPDELIAAAHGDKKRTEDKINFVFIEEIGRCAVREVTFDELRKLM